MSTVADKPYQVITDRILSLLEQGTVPWQKPWNAEQGQPRNLFTQRKYNGVNLWLLGSMGYASPFWCTFNQAKAAGGMVKRGEHGVPVVFWKIYDKENEEGEKEKRFALKYFTVFNSAQIDGVAVPSVEPVPYEHTPIERCEKLVGGYPLPPQITHGGTRAFYRPSSDAVHMPMPETFVGPERYYSTLFHELTHSTGHSSRLNRKTLKDAVAFGDRSYAQEELMADMGAAYLCGVCGIENATIDNSASYIQGWRQALKHDPKCVVTAAGQAQKAADYIQNLQVVPQED